MNCALGIATDPAPRSAADEALSQSKAARTAEGDAREELRLLGIQLDTAQLQLEAAKVEAEAATQIAADATASRDQAELEAQKSAETLRSMQTENKRLVEQIGEMGGHKNDAQRIRQFQKVLDENTKLKDESREMQAQILKMQSQIEKLRERFGFKRYIYCNSIFSELKKI